MTPLQQEIASHEQDIDPLTVLINEQGELLHEMHGDSALATVEDITEDPDYHRSYRGAPARR